MDYLDIFYKWLEAALQGTASAQFAFTVLMAGAVFVLVLGLLLVAYGFSDPLRRRLENVGTRKASASSTLEQVADSLGTVGKKFLPKQEAERSRIENLLLHAGFPSEGAVRFFFAAKLLLLCVLPLAVLSIMFFFGMPTGTQMLWVAIAGSVGFLLPNWWLYRAARRRQLKLRRSLPDALDLMVVCAEAGLGLSALIQRVSADIKLAHPEIATELEIYTMQTGAGVDSRTALRDLQFRTGVEEIRGLVSTLIQSMRFGTSIAEALRIFSNEMRDKRRQAAEERAAKVSIKMLFPLIVCIFPSFLLVSLGPSMLAVAHVFRTVSSQ